MGDTLTEKGELTFTGLPDFAPEILRRVRLGDPMKVKQMRRGLSNLAEEGVIRLFKPSSGGASIVGVIGELQLNVLTARMKQEYGTAVEFEAAPYEVARWVRSKNAALLKRLTDAHQAQAATDRDGDAVLLMRNAWEFDRLVKDWPEVEFAAVRERNSASS